MRDEDNTRDHDDDDGAVEGDKRFVCEGPAVQFSSPRDSLSDSRDGFKLADVGIHALRAFWLRTHAPAPCAEHCGVLPPTRLTGSCIRRCLHTYYLLD